MAAKKSEPARPRAKRGPIMMALAALAIGVAFVAWSYWPTPQMGADAEVFRTVDALFTAINAKDERWLGDCESRLHNLRAAGKLPPNAGAHLDAIIQTARAGNWRPAAVRLYDFMRAQRRAGRTKNSSGRWTMWSVQQVADLAPRIYYG